MKYIKQFGIILLIAFIGELLRALLPFPIPASIYGIILLFLCLWSGIIPVGSVKEVSGFLVEIMPILFVPSAVGLMASWNILKNSWLQYAVVMVATTFVVMAVSGKVTQAIIRMTKKGEKSHE